MPLPVTVTSIGGDRYRVEITGHTRHEVTAGAGVLGRVARPGEDAAATIRRAFAFLLDREPPESILPRFPLEVVGRYFPDFWEEMARPL